MCQHHSARFGKCGHQRLQCTVRGKKSIDQRSTQVQAFQKGHITVADISRTGDADNHATESSQLPLHFLPESLIGIPRQVEMADACILFHSFHKGSIRLLLSDAEHGNITFHRCQREDIEIIVQYSHCRTAQLGSQRLRFLRIDAIAHSADPKLRLAVSQTKHILVHQYLAALGIKFVLTQLSRLHCIYQLLHRILRIELYQHHIISRQQRFGSYLRNGRHTLHVQGIGKHQPFKAEFILQQPGHHIPRQGRRSHPVRVQRLHLQMAYHDTPQSGTYHFLEGIKFHTVQACTVVVQGRKRLMRIHIRIAMPGEMLANGKYAPAFEPTAVCHHLFRHPLRVLAKGAYVYHRVQRIRIDIRIGCKIDVYPQFAELAGHLTSIFFNQAIVLDTSQGGITGIVRSAFQPH